MSFFSKTDNLSEIAIYKLYLEVVLGLLNLTIREDRYFFIVKYNYKCYNIHLVD